MTALVVTLASIAAALEAGGLLLTVRDIHAARRRLADYLQRRSVTYASLGLAATSEMAMDLIPQNQTLEQRLTALEAWKRGLPDELAHRERQLSDRIRGDYTGALTASEKTVGDQLEGVREYLQGADEHRWVSYRGPAILGFGIAVGLAANILSAI
ncbi:hypothetical protein [Streptomyces sp. NPDC088794]|uniref:hypothetical protein n=1 Tax=Streptomyces sp. NPDC088794 TaxID=3365902 RepID=UPI0038031409